MTTPAPAAVKTKISGMFRRVSITADSNGDLPSRIELLTTGEWPASSNKGPLQESVGSLGEYKRNFDAGISQSKDSDGNWLGLPIDFMHESWDQAGAWIKAMEVAPSSQPDLPADEGGMSLWASQVDYTDAGKQAIIGGMFKCFSPSWWPASRGDWTDPEDPNITARNVIDGGGFTNQPFFKGLQSLTASNQRKVAGNDDNNVIYIKADERNAMPTLDEVRVKDKASLTDEEKTVLEDNKAELSADELAKFELTAAPVDAPTQTPNTEVTTVTDPEAAAVTAALKNGTMVAVQASTWDALQKDVKKMKRDKIEASVTAHIARGAIKADQFKPWVDRIEADASAEELLKGLNDNPLLATEIGSTAQEKQTEEAQVELHALTASAMREEKNKGKKYSEVRASILKEKPELKSALDKEEK